MKPDPGEAEFKVGKVILISGYKFDGNRVCSATKAVKASTRCDGAVCGFVKG